MANAKKYMRLVHLLFDGKVSSELFYKEVRRLRAGELPLFANPASVPANGQLIRPDRKKVKSAALPGRNPRALAEGISHE